MNLDSLLELFKSFSFSELVSCKASLENVLKEKKLENLAMSPGDYIDFVPDFLQNDSLLYQSILAELQSESSGFKSKSTKTSTSWLTTTGEQYVWSAGLNGPVTVKNPVDMDKFPAISKLMNGINSQYGCKLNSCLVSYYRCGASSTRYHSDDESSLDPTEGLYVVSFGAKRIIDVLPMAGDKRHKSDFYVEANDGSMYIMKPGCQENMVHQVRSDSSVKGERFSLSFRCLKTQQTAKEGKPNSATDATEPATSPATTPAATSTKSEVKPSDSTTPIYYRHSPRKPKRRRTTVLFGTSMTKYVRTKQLGFRGRKVVNMSQSGAKIKDMKNIIRTFYEFDEAAMSNDIEKVIFSLGTNDVKYSKVGVRHLKGYLSELISFTKSLFPAAIVIFQCCLPIRCMYPYIARNVIEFNLILKDLCFLNNCVYLDCFKDFLTFDRRFCNADLYHDWLHLNNKGVGVLSTWLKYVVNENSFDRVIDNLLGL